MPFDAVRHHADGTQVPSGPVASFELLAEGAGVSDQFAMLYVFRPAGPAGAAPDAVGVASAG